MASSLSLLLLSFVCIVVTSDNLQVGTSINGSLAYSEVVKLSSVPLKIRTKNVFYTDENNRIIKRSVGRPLTRWMDELVKVAGSRWVQAAANQSNWRSMGEAYVQQ
ncbi:hypothetical protein MSG28_007805 [Choristoneura fumiferana]|uniref:Uncharacterized protein n=1 Tax=Choristoneura fumiferana TaxID=7141 RepID=A0ACC0JZD0_CHOFU|nr:hypothetical protein MSG28_007805 [Choristoneura fumiferana]